MNDVTRGSRADLPTLSADLLLVHAPAVYDFRDRDDIYFPFLGTSGDVPITPLYEYFPVGFKSLQRHLETEGHRVAILNLSSLFIRYPKLSIDRVLNALDVPVIGIDLHWMVHVHGSHAIADEIKRVRPDIKVLFGGISSTYYADELVRNPSIDMVMRGYDTLAPMSLLMQAIKAGGRFDGVPNLIWTAPSGDVVDNGMSYLPGTYSCGADWARQPEAPKQAKGLRIREVLSTQNAGCAYNCGWCGGSREAFRRIYNRKRAMARKPRDEIRFEFETLQKVPDIDRFHYYSVGSYNEPQSGMEHFLDQVAETDLKSISYEQFHLTSEPILKRMAEANARTAITLSPESHDPHVAKLAGRGVYTNDEMEDWIARALDLGIHQIDIWYFVGMPEQDAVSVDETVDYCERLLKRFQGRNVNPMICPMIPFLDPASTFFDQPEQHGYRSFFRTAEDHRAGMESASIINRTSYETRWLSREDLVYVGYASVRRLMEIKAEYGFLPNGIVSDYVRRIDDAVDFVREVHAADCIADPRARKQALAPLGPEILARNNEILFSGVANQAFPVNREVGGRWFDEMGWPLADLDRVHGALDAGEAASV